MTFNILDHVERLQPSPKGGQYFTCPVCNGSSLSIAPDTGAYTCWSGDCDTADIRNSIAPLPSNRSIAPTKSRRIEQVREWIYTDSDNRPLIRVTRKDTESGKRIFQNFWFNGRWVRKVDSATKQDYYSRVMPLEFHRVWTAARSAGFLILAEGESTSDALNRVKIPATTYIKNSRNLDVFGPLIEQGIELVLAPDMDAVGVRTMEKVAELYPSARWAYSYPDSPIWQSVDKGTGVDFADWIADGNGADQIQATIGDRRHKVPPERASTNATAGKADTPLKGLAKVYADIKRVWGEVEPGPSGPGQPSMLAFNELTRSIELCGRPLDLDLDRVALAVTHGVSVGANDFAAVVAKLAAENSFHPIRDYLDSVSSQHGGDTSILDGIAERYFGVDGQIYESMLVRTLIAAVARIYEPGCKMDTVLILQGRQGIGKSTFFQTLAGEWFDDTYGATENVKDENLKIFQSWFLEWSELETVFRKRDIARVKAFISTSTDNIREPYARNAKRLARPSVFVGTTNQTDFLSDSTGNRRFWVIPVEVDRIDTAKLARDRDKIWSAAVALYRAGEQWWLTDLEERAADLVAKSFESSDPWEAAIFAYLDEILETGGQRQSVLTTEVLDKACMVPIDRQGKREQMRISNIMARSGMWEKRRESVDGNRVYIWHRLSPAQPPAQPAQPAQPPTKGWAAARTVAGQGFDGTLPNLPNLNPENKTENKNAAHHDTEHVQSDESKTQIVLPQKVGQVRQVRQVTLELPGINGSDSAQPLPNLGDSAQPASIGWADMANESGWRGLMPGQRVARISKKGWAGRLIEFSDDRMCRVIWDGEKSESVASPSDLRAVG